MSVRGASAAIQAVAVGRSELKGGTSDSTGIALLCCPTDNFRSRSIGRDEAAHYLLKDLRECF